MASSSSLLPFAHSKRYHVFPSFHGGDVRRAFLSHLHNYFANKGITTFKDQEIERGHLIGPELVKAINESRVSIVLLSKNYASSSWCLDELVEILKCKEDSGQIVMTVFYDVDPSSVRKQKEDFGSAFMKTCQGKTEEEKQRWTQALTHVANIEGEHYLNWANEADMIQKIAADVSKKLNLTVSRDFERMVGMEAHLENLNSLLCLERDDEVKMIGIWGPAGIGKSSIARALFTQVSSHFPLSCFMENLGGVVSYRKEYELGLDLQKQFLFKILNQRDIRVHHSGVVKEWLQDQRALIILDDVDDLEKLDLLAKDPSWFGNGSRIIVTTQDKKILKARRIEDIYRVEFPSKEEALEMLSLYAFEQSCVPYGFEEVARKVVELCGNLPLALSVVGSSLREASKDEWELEISSIESSLDGKIGGILRVGYDRLSENHKALFLHMACLFENDFYDARSLLADSILAVEHGLQTLLVRSLVQTSIIICSGIEMHSLLVQMGRQIVREKSEEAGKRQFIVEPQEIRDVLANETGSGSVIGISADMEEVREFSISGRAFEGMPNLRFLQLYGYRLQLGISEELEYLPRLRLLVWPCYPRKRLPQKFETDCLVQLSMFNSKLEKLWDGIKPLPNLRIIDLTYSAKLKEIPNLSEASNLEILKLEGCTRLVELPSYIGNLHQLILLIMTGCRKLRVIPSSIGNLHKLKTLDMNGCKNLRVIPTNINLASLEEVDMSYCSQLTTFPDFSTNIKELNVSGTMIKDVPASVAGGWSRLDTLEIGIRSLTKLDLRSTDIKNIPDCVIGLPGLEILNLQHCKKLVSLQSLPPSLLYLYATDCRSLKSVSFSFDEPRAYLTLNDCTCVKSEKDAKSVSSSITFYHPKRRVFLNNCWSLDEEATRAIIQRWAYMSACLPGKQVPADFTHKTKGNSISISPGTFSASSRFKACVLLTPTGQFSLDTEVVCHLRSKGVLINELEYKAWCREVDATISGSLTEHLFVFSGSLFK